MPAYCAASRSGASSRMNARVCLWRGVGRLCRWRGLAVLVISVAADESLPPDTVRVPRSEGTFIQSEATEIPPLRLRRNAGGQWETLRRDEIRAELLRITGVDFREPGSGPPGQPFIGYRADEYAVVDHRWFSEVVFRLWLEMRYWNLTYARDYWDCDEYCLALGALADLALLRAPGHPRAPPQLFGSMIVRQVHPWGLAPVGGTHALVLFRSERSWWVADPQNGRTELLEKFPNRGSIREILFR